MVDVINLKVRKICLPLIRHIIKNLNILFMYLYILRS